MIKKIEKRGDAWYMQKALALAQKAYELDEVPIGAIVVQADGAVIGRGYNMVENKKSQNAHAEIVALAKASKKINNWRLEQCTLYVTLEPCTMCMGLARLSRVSKIVFAAPSKLFGYRLDKNDVHPLYKKDAIEMIEGVCHSQSEIILKHFFQQKRKEKGG